MRLLSGGGQDVGRFREVVFAVPIVGLPLNVVRQRDVGGVVVGRRLRRSDRRRGRTVRQRPVSRGRVLFVAPATCKFTNFVNEMFQEI
jgi:hypothetical protein